MRLLHFHFENQNRLLKGTGAKRDDCPGTSVSEAKFPFTGLVGAYGLFRVFLVFSA